MRLPMRRGLELRIESARQCRVAAEDRFPLELDALAPALGLPPGMPGMPVADTLARQIWWFTAAIGTGAAFVLVAKVRAPWALALAVALVLLPHLIAAPQAPNDPTGVPPRMTAEFVAAVIFNGALFWAVLGLVFGRMADVLAARPATIPNGAKA